MTAFEPMMMDKGNYLLLTAAVAPPGQPWAGNLRAFFSMPPQAGHGPPPDSEEARGGETVNQVYDTRQPAEAGALFNTAIAALGKGDSVTARQLFRHLFCMERYGLFLARGANGDAPTMRRARDFPEPAAEAATRPGHSASSRSSCGAATRSRPGAGQACNATSSCRRSSCDVVPESHGRLPHDNGRTSCRKFL